MIPTEILRRYPVFAGLKDEHKKTLANSSNEFSVDEGHYFFREEDILNQFFLVLEGTVEIVIAITDREENQSLTRQLTNNLINRDVAVSNVGEGNIFGWSALVPPHNSTAGARAQTPCRVVSFDCEELRSLCEEDHEFGHLMTRKAAQIIRDRYRDLRTESLSKFAN